MLAWLERIKGWLLLAGLALAALASVFYRGRATGSQAERQERQDQINEQAAQARQEVRDVQDHVARQNDGAVVADLKSRWVRGPGSGGR
ncbi:hypothetical protein [Achromobacter sp. RTa]|uniref:hypothetical protein n=1 Tax=Achromobacter sp. RTa TaxID=1532557 RepID=UPI0009DD25BA|nr:hypothetical protein [Achromobacter sp. RTa]